jgi:hypothetical protein
MGGPASPVGLASPGVRVVILQVERAHHEPEQNQDCESVDHDRLLGWVLASA